MADDLYSIENLKKWQDDIIEQAKQELKENRMLVPMAFFLTEKGRMKDGLGEILLAPKGQEVMNEDTEADASVVILMPLQLNAVACLNIIKEAETNEGNKFLIEFLEKEGSRHQVPNADEILLKVLMQRMQIGHKDIVAKGIRQMIQKTGAMAYVKIDESWYVDSDTSKTADLDKYRGKLEDHPDRQETIVCFLETENLTRMVNVLFKRDSPDDTGNVVSFEEPKELIEAYEKGVRSTLSGRFVNLFHKAKEEENPGPTVH